MRSPPGRLLALIWVVAAFALASAVVICLRWPITLTPRASLLAGMLLAMVFLARRSSVQLAANTRTQVSTAPLFAAVLLLSPSVAMIAAALGAGAADLTRRSRWFQALFNTSEVTLRVGVGVAVFRIAGGHQALTNLAPGRWLAGAPLTGLAMYLANTLLMDLVLAAQFKRRPLQDFWRRRRVTAPQEGSLFLLGLLVAGIGASDPLAIALLVIPLFVVHRSLRDGVALRNQTREALEELADIVDMRDHYTFEHSRRVAALARITAESLGLHRDDVELIEMAGRVHDVGKIGIKSTVLLKGGRLTEVEWQEMRTHPEIGARLVAKFPYFARGRDLMLSHHERYDGKGYPRRLAGEKIPLGGRVLAVADAWDAMTSHRAYRRALPMEEVYAELERGRNSQFDPVVLDAFLGALRRHPELASPHTEEVQEVDDGPTPPPLPLIRGRQR